MKRCNVYTASSPMSGDTESQVLAIMEEAFPPTERRVREGQIALMRHPLYRVHALEEDGRVLGFMAAWALDGLTFFEHFAMDSALRGAGLGGEMLDGLLNACEGSAVLEVELPEDDIARRRIAFYRRHGLHLNERAYDQLPLRPGDGRTPMYLMSWPHSLNDAEFVAFRREIYRHVYGVQE